MLDAKDKEQLDDQALDEQIEGRPASAPAPTTYLFYDETAHSAENPDQAAQDFLKKIAGKKPMDSNVAVNGDWTHGKHAIKALIDSGAEVIEGEGCKFDKETQERLEVADKIRRRMKSEKIIIYSDFFKGLVETELQYRKQSAADNSDSTDAVKKSTTDLAQKTDNTATTNPDQQKPANSDALELQAKKGFKPETFIVATPTLKKPSEQCYDEVVNKCMKRAEESQMPFTELTATIHGSWKGKGAEAAIKKLMLLGVEVNWGKDFKPSPELEKLNVAAKKVRQDMEKEAGTNKSTKTFEERVNEEMSVAPSKASWMAPPQKPNSVKPSNANPGSPEASVPKSPASTAPASWTKKAITIAEPAPSTPKPL